MLSRVWNDVVISDVVIQHHRMGAGQECRVCGVEADCVRREVDTAAAWYTEVLQEALGETYDQFQKFCNTCDRLISEFEEVRRQPVCTEP